MKIASLGLVLAATLAVTASAANAADDSNGATQILKGDYASAERIIREQEKMFPGDPDLLLNLAMVYRRTGRMSEARSLYRSVLARPDELMDMPNSSIPLSGHTLARTALLTMDATQLSAR